MLVPEAQMSDFNYSEIIFQAVNKMQTENVLGYFQKHKRIKI